MGGGGAKKFSPRGGNKLALIGFFGGGGGGEFIECLFYESPDKPRRLKYTPFWHSSEGFSATQLTRSLGYRVVFASAREVMAKVAFHEKERELLFFARAPEKFSRKKQKKKRGRREELSLFFTSVVWRSGSKDFLFSKRFVIGIFRLFFMLVLE